MRLSSNEEKYIYKNIFLVFAELLPPENSTKSLFHDPQKIESHNGDIVESN